MYAAATGNATPVTEVPDPVFADKILGDGVAIVPTDGKIVSPVNGVVVEVTETLHAFGLESDDGLEILIHIGLNTVELNGKGFTPFVKAGDKVKVGTPLCKVDLDVLQAAGYPLWTPVLITNMDAVQGITLHTGPVVAGETRVVEYQK